MFTNNNLKIWGLYQCWYGKVEKSGINPGISYPICKVLDFLETLDTHVPVYFIPDKPFETLQARG
jgi:hypothetical protein